MDRFLCQVLSMEFACVESRYHPSGSVVRVSLAAPDSSKKVRSVEAVCSTS